MFIIEIEYNAHLNTSSSIEISPIQCESKYNGIQSGCWKIALFSNQAVGCCKPISQNLLSSLLIKTRKAKNSIKCLTPAENSNHTEDG